MVSKLLCVLPAVCCLLPAGASAALTYSNPFHPEQCDLAIAYAEGMRSCDLGDARAREILAEGLLCRGLTQDDPWALDRARRAFEEQLALDQGDFFAQIYFAAALRRRFPLSDAVPVAFERAGALLAEADVGAARRGLAAHLDRALGAVGAHRRQFLPLLGRREAELAAPDGALTPEHLAELVTLLAQTGPLGIERGLDLLDAHLAERYDAALDTFHRAELLRGRDDPAVVGTLYRAAAAALCTEDAANRPSECKRARWRLEQLEDRRQLKGG